MTTAAKCGINITLQSILSAPQRSAVRRISALLLLPLFAMPAFFLKQEVPIPAPAILDITGVNAASAPDVTITVQVTDIVGQNVRGLDVKDFQLGGALSSMAEIVRVESTEDNLPFAVVLVIDTSSSMSGTPLQRTQAAAKAFINALGPEDPVAIVSFSSDASVLREFTTDKADLLGAIDGLVPFGQTALYDGAVTGIELAAKAPYPRRAVILLSDGAEYGGASLSRRENAAELSPVRGVPVYTIGLGFGLDRTYLQNLSEVSSARFYESPTPEQLTTIYNELATLFRTQYVLTLNFRGALDGRIYPFTLRAVTEAGQSGVDAATLRAPIPTPVVSVSPEPTAPLAAPVTFTATVRGDQEIVQVDFSVNGTDVTDTEKPFTFDFDPFTVAPGDYTLTVRATDTDGDSGEKLVPFTVAPIASRITIDTDFSALGPITRPVTVTVNAAFQTPLQSIDYRVDGESLGVAAALPASFTLNPFDFAPGPHTVEFVVTDMSGAEASITQTAEIAALPPVITNDLSALPEGEIFDPISVRVSAEGQTPIQNMAFTANGQTTIFEGLPEVDYLIDPNDFAPGQQTVIVIVTDEAGTSAAGQIMFTVGLLTPTVTVEGIADEDVLDGVRLLTVNVSGQTSKADVTLMVDMQEVDRLQEMPYVFAIDPVTLFASPGTHLLGINVVNEFGASAQVDLRLTVAEAAYPTSTPDAAATESANALIVQATTDAVATVQSNMTAEALAATAAQATGEALATEAAVATADALATREVEATLQQEAAFAQATLDTAATARAILTATARADIAQQRLMTAEAQATLEIQATVDAQLTEIAEQTAVAQATMDVEATLNTTRVAATQIASTQSAATAQALDAQETSVALETAQAELTADAEGRVTAQAEMALVRQSTADAQAARETARAATREAVTLVAQVEATDAAQLALTTAAQPSLTPTVEPSATAEPATEQPVTEQPATEQAAAVATDLPTVEATVLQPTATVFDPTSTPGSPTDIVAEGANTPDTQIALIAVIAGTVLLLLIGILIAAARRRRRE